MAGKREAKGLGHTLSCISDDLYRSMPSLAIMASLRVSILTNAWRFSTLTMHVWTSPNAEKMPRKTSSDDLCQLLKYASPLKFTQMNDDDDEHEHEDDDGEHHDDQDDQASFSMRFS